jgi:hypothetical protein
MEHMFSYFPFSVTSFAQGRFQQTAEEGTGCGITRSLRRLASASGVKR